MKTLNLSLLCVLTALCCGVHAATPQSEAPALSDVLLVPETSPVFPGMYCVASYSIVHGQLIGLEGIPQIVAEDAKQRGANLAAFLEPLVLEHEQLNAEDMLSEILVIRTWLITFGDGDDWYARVEEYDCKGITNQWALIVEPHTPL